VKVYYNIEDIKLVNPVITVGTFDGVHLGHRKIIKKLIEKSIELNGASVVFTFQNHPRNLLFPNEELNLLNTNSEKIHNLEKLGIDIVIAYDFTYEFSQLNSHEFIRKILIDKLNIKHLIFGFNHHFGKNREGDFKNIKECAEKYNFTVERVDAFKIDDQNISSTKIRKALQSADIETANKYLGYNYFIIGIVIEGNKIGREIGFPTANLLVEKNKLLPENGVYAVIVYYMGEKYVGMLNIGTRPTLNNSNSIQNIEVHIIDFNKTIYGESLKIELLRKMRDEKKFESLADLKRQIEKDKNLILDLFNETLYKPLIIKQI
jgi:riboflavin kinase / FMN adenylyltransferase